MSKKEDALKKIAKDRIGKMFGRGNNFRGLNAFFPKASHKKSHPPSKKNTVSKMNTVSKKTTVAKMNTVVNEQTILKKISAIIKNTPQLVYLNLYRLTRGQNRTITNPLGYTEIAQLCNISNSTARRAIRTLTQKGLIERTEIKNEKDIKGSKYKTNMPPWSK